MWGRWKTLEADWNRNRSEAVGLAECAGSGCTIPRKAARWPLLTILVEGWQGELVPHRYQQKGTPELLSQLTLSTCSGRSRCPQMLPLWFSEHH